METKWSYATLALYLIIALVISLLFKRSIIAKKKKSKFPTYIFYYMVIFIILILFSCFRTIDGNNRIGGADAPNYIKMFQEAKMPKFNIL